LLTFLSQVQSSKLASYVAQCLESSFPKGGLILQDLINEFARRLDYKVVNGRYQGTSNAVGFDGVWISPEGHAVIAEVKTTDAYRNHEALQKAAVKLKALDVLPSAEASQTAVRYAA
jgi:hypothetical protein